LTMQNDIHVCSVGIVVVKRPVLLVFGITKTIVVYLTEDNLCSKYDEIKKHKGQWMSPAFGFGCSSALFNSDRERKIRERNSKRD